MSRVEGRTGAAGRSAAAKARQVVEEARGGPVRRLLAGVGLDPGAGRVRAARAVARRWEAGARGEKMTAELLEPLRAEGWGGWYDRALPTGRANFDAVLVAPAGDLVVLVDSKLWARGRGVVRRSVTGRLRHGREDRESAAEAFRYETGVLEAELKRVRARARVVPVIVVHSAPVAGGRFMLAGGITVIEAAGLVELLRGMGGEPDRRAFDRLSVRAGSVLPRYEQSSR